MTVQSWIYSPGYDGTVLEMIKAYQDIMAPVLVTLFNSILDTASACCQY